MFHTYRACEQYVRSRCSCAAVGYSRHLDMSPLYHHYGLMKQLTLRLPDDLHLALKALAARENRSMHAQLLHLLAREIAREEEREMHAILPSPQGDGPLA